MNKKEYPKSYVYLSIKQKQDCWIAFNKYKGLEDLEDLKFKLLEICGIDADPILIEMFLFEAVNSTDFQRKILEFNQIIAKEQNLNFF